MEWALDLVAVSAEYRTELFYPSYYNERRPEPDGLLSRLSYGGPFFNVTLSSDDLFGDVRNAQTAQVIILRFGFSTHAIVKFNVSWEHLTTQS
jgi:hypothetical protein